MLFDILGRRHAEMFLKHGGEGADVRETNRISHLRDILLLLGEQACCLLHAHVLDEVADGQSGELLHLAMQMRAADAHLLTDELRVKLVVAEMVVDALHNTLQQQFVEILTRLV